MAKSKRKYTQAPLPPDCEKITLDGDVNVDISSTDLQEIVDGICECIENAAWVAVQCPPCILVNGVPAEFVSVYYNPALSEQKYVDATGVEIDPTTIEIVTDLCDPRCACEPCGDGNSNGNDEECCECETLQDKIEIANMLAGVIN